jgi:hypothetical protein
MARRLNDKVAVKQAVSNSNWAVGAVTGQLVDVTGFSRARFVFSFGANGGTTAALNSSAAIWKASSSGATFTEITETRLAAVTSGVLANQLMVIDTATDPSNPWLRVSGMSVLSTAINANVVVTLYAGVNNPPTNNTQQTVVVG